MVIWWVILQSQLPSVEHPGNLLPSVILDAPSRNWFHSSLFVQTLIWGANAALYANQSIPTMSWFKAQQTSMGGLFVIARETLRGVVWSQHDRKQQQPTTMPSAPCKQNSVQIKQKRQLQTQAISSWDPTVWERPHMIALMLILKWPESNVLGMQTIFTIKQKHDVFGKESSFG